MTFLLARRASEGFGPNPRLRVGLTISRTSLMAQKRPLLTPEIEAKILAYVRAGGFAHVAAEAAGVSREVFEEWMRKGESKRAIPKYRLFAEKVRQAEATARLGAEVAA